MAGPDVRIESVDDSGVEIHGLDSEQVGEIAAKHGIVLHELTPQRASLEEAFMELTRDAVEFHAESPEHAIEPEGAPA